MVDNSFTYTFPALRGIQAGRQYYVSMCPLRLVPRLFTFNDEELDPELRAQRVLNKSRVPAMATYILENPTEYVFSALTASIDAEVEFVAVSEKAEHYNVGWLRVPMSARLIINDGQHRRAAIEAALKERPDIGDETIAIVFFMDLGLARSQQMFADLNRYAIRPTKSLSVLFDHRDPLAAMARDIVSAVDVFDGMTELAKTTISNRSTKLFTLSGIHRATVELLKGSSSLSYDEQRLLAIEFWNAIASHLPEWGQVRAGAYPRLHYGRTTFTYIPLHLPLSDAQGAASYLNGHETGGSI